MSSTDPISGPGYSPDAARESTSSPALGADAGRNRAGVVSLVIGIVAVVYGLAQQLVGLFAPVIVADLALGANDIGLVFAGLNLVGGLIATVGAIAGVVGITRTHTRRLAAAAGLGINGSVLIGALFSIVVPFLVSAAY
ncbi:MAG: hypothetical protein ABW040_00530 [Microbacteriaceae bacterium]